MDPFRSTSSSLVLLLLLCTAPLLILFCPYLFYSLNFYIIIIILIIILFLFVLFHSFILFLHPNYCRFLVLLLIALVFGFPSIQQNCFFTSSYSSVLKMEPGNYFVMLYHKTTWWHIIEYSSCLSFNHIVNNVSKRRVYSLKKKQLLPHRTHTASFLQSPFGWCCVRV
jgi:hypothetical protein